MLPNCGLQDVLQDSAELNRQARDAALLAAALAQPTKEWLTPALDSPAVAPVAVAADAAMDTATGGQP